MVDKPSRKVALTRRIKLSSVGEGWDDCYADVRLATFDEVSAAGDRDFSKMKYAEIIRFEMGLVSEYFVGGKILIVNADGKPQLDDMTVADIKSYASIADALYAGIMGLTLDPKDIPKDQ